MAETPGIVSEQHAVETNSEALASVELFAGSELSGGETEDITLRWPTQLIVFAGAEDSGKTTMLAALYEHLGRGSFAGFDFAGSRSILGFEKICHANRIISESLQPTTERTIPSYEAAYYHLALRETNGARRRRQVLFSALSGELFRWARNSREECEKLTFLHRANTIVVLVDGEKLASMERRNNAHSDAAGIVDAFLDANMVPAGCQVEFVFSKLDCIRAAGDVALAFLKQTQEKLESKFRPRVPQLMFRHLAARPRPNADHEELADGIGSAFAKWISPPERSENDGGREPAPSSGVREFSKYGWRRSDEAWRTKL